MQLGIANIMLKIISCENAPYVDGVFPISLKQTSAALSGEIRKKDASSLLFNAILVATPAGLNAIASIECSYNSKFNPFVK